MTRPSCQTQDTAKAERPLPVRQAAWALRRVGSSASPDGKRSGRWSGSGPGDEDGAGTPAPHFLHCRPNPSSMPPGAGVALQGTCLSRADSGQRSVSLAAWEGSRDPQRGSGKCRRRGRMTKPSFTSKRPPRRAREGSVSGPDARDNRLQARSSHSHRTRLPRPGGQEDATGCPRASCPSEAPGEGPSCLSQDPGPQASLGRWPRPSRLCLRLHVASPLCLCLLFCPL